MYVTVGITCGQLLMKGMIILSLCSNASSSNSGPPFALHMRVIWQSHAKRSTVLHIPSLLDLVFHVVQKISVALHLEVVN